jgi:beta-mannosidase
MFGGPAFDVGHLLKDHNELVVKIEPIVRMEEPDGWRDNKSWRKTVVFNNVYGWHYSYIPSLGIWRSVHLDAKPTVKVVDPFIVTIDAAAGRMKLRVDLGGSGGGRLVGVIAPHNADGNWYRFEKRIEQPGKQLLEFTIPNPRLWWPNGEGEQPLYRLTVQFIPDKGPADRAMTTFGIRTIEMRPQPSGPKADEYNWIFVINGRPMFITGTGWCTMDSNLDFRRERYSRFLQTAKDGHCKMVRAWGSGMPETDEFYDLCDELGLLVMQEWPTAWNSHNDQPFEALEETVRLNTIRLRNRPSLVMWGGGNESSKPVGPAIDMMGRHAIGLDGTRPFHRGEPWGGSKHDYTCWWDKAHLDHNLKMTSRFFGEFGICSLPVLESVLRYLPDEERHLWPPKPGGVFEYHVPIFNRYGEMDRLRQYSGNFSAGKTVERFILGSQLAQVVGARHTLERARTRWPDCTGALLYKLNDNYPAASWSTIDWYGTLKPAHYFVQDAFEPLQAVVLFDSVNNHMHDLKLPVYLLDDRQSLAGQHWEVRVKAYAGSLKLVREQRFSGDGAYKTANHVGYLLLVPKQTDTTPLFVVTEVYVGRRRVSGTFYFVNYEAQHDSLFELPRTRLSHKVKGGHVTILNTGGLPAVAVNVRDVANLDTFSAGDGYFWLEPGESRRVSISSHDDLCVEAWNA